MNEWPNRVNKSVSKMYGRDFSKNRPIEIRMEISKQKQFTGRYCREYAKNKHACVRCKLVFKSDIGKYVRILRLSLGIACGVSKDNAAVGARLYSLFSPFIQLWCESNFAIT